tara:strand:- start:801 stop:1469 length:669 start_codon:yes stop_codon:yes gene_type:complete
MKKGYLTNKYDEKSHPYTDYSRKLCEYLCKVYELKKGMTMLEPGCGRCEHLKHFQDLGLEVFGSDISNEVLEYATNIDIKISDLEKNGLPYQDNSMDIIYSKSFIEHLSDPGLYLKEANRVLKPGGLLLTLVPDWEANYKIYFDDYTHKTPFTKISLRDAYNIHGFTSTEVIKFRQLPLVWKYPILNYLCYLISPFIPNRSSVKFLRWSKELMLIGSGYKVK